MNLDYHQARAASIALLDEVKQHDGEAVLLWHNTQLAKKSASPGSYQRQLYLDLLAHLKKAVAGA